MPAVNQTREINEIRVTMNIHGVPLSFMMDSQRHHVAAIYEQCQETGDEPGRVTAKDYFKIKTNKGLICDIYREREVKLWHISKIYHS